MSKQFETMKAAILRVGDGRGFVVKHRNYLGMEERAIITAAHCLPDLPRPHPARYIHEETYQNLLGPLRGIPTVWTACLFVDPIADVAVLGQPDNQALSDEADAYDQLLEGMETLTIADAPAQGVEVLTFGDQKVRNPTPGVGPARVLSLEGDWLDGRVSGGAVDCHSSRKTSSSAACRARRSYPSTARPSVLSRSTV
jgi:hypothetical protein